MNTSVTVWIESWQMQCCGTPFKLGDTVNWTVLECVFVDPSVDVGKIDFYYENHAENNDGLFEIEGMVSHILAIHHAYELKKKTRTKIPISGMTTPVYEADGWEKDMDGMEFAAYCVKLENASPPKKAWLSKLRLESRGRLG
jgi:hypothetical protein